MNNIFISENFKLKEFQSPDTKEVKLDEKLIKKLEKLRYKINEYLATENTPIIISSGYRTWEYHVDLYKRKFGNEWKEHISENSFHLKGKAADLQCPKRMTIDKFSELAEKVGFKAIGTYSWGIHVDTRDYKARW